jgi:nitrate/nitrite transporter NarK
MLCSKCIVVFVVCTVACVNKLLLRSLEGQFVLLITLFLFVSHSKGKGKGKVYPRTGHEGPEGK